MAVFKEDVLSEIKKKRKEAEDLRNVIDPQTTVEHKRHADILDDRIETLKWAYDLVKKIKIGLNASGVGDTRC